MAEQTPQPDDQNTPEPANADGVPDAQNLPGDDAAHSPDAALDGVKAALAQLSEVSTTAATDATSPSLEGAAVASGGADTMSMLGDVSLRVKIELGRTRMYIEDVLKLNEHSIIELDRAAGDPVDIYVNDRYIARGEVLVVNDNFCVRVSELVDAEPASAIAG